MFNHESRHMMTYDITRDLLYLRTTSPEGLTFLTTIYSSIEIIYCFVSFCLVIDILASFRLDQVCVIMSLTNIVDKTRYQPPKAMYKEAEFCV